VNSSGLGWLDGLARPRRLGFGGRLLAAQRAQLRRPVLSLVLSVGLLLALAVPALSLHVSKPSDLALTGNDEPALKTLAQVRRDFPQTAEAAIVVVRGPKATGAQATRAIARLQAEAVRRGVAHGPTRVSISDDRDAAAGLLPLTGNGANGPSREPSK
jgi:uncharacterized membrane protein YdfJ with MMPL/SSD domain